MSQPRMIGHYEIRELLGEGGIGQVHAARDTVLGRDVAIKSLRPKLLNDPSFVERFRAEATNLARLNHPNITTIYSLLQADGNMCMVMELVRGRTLDVILQNKAGPFTVEEALALIGQAADGLAYAHGMGIIHRDIKPSNLMVTETGLLKIMDFGIARVAGSQRLTRDGSVVGTLAYMAPEQLLSKETDGRADLYSLAIVLYEMLSGSVPFTADSDYELMRAQINDPPERITKRVAGLDPHIEKVLTKALSKNPEDRHSSVLAFKEALGAPADRSHAMTVVQKATRLIGTLPGSLAATVAAGQAAAPVSRARSSSFVAVRDMAIATVCALAAVAAFFLVRDRMFQPTTVATSEPTKLGQPADVASSSRLPATPAKPGPPSASQAVVAPPNPYQFPRQGQPPTSGRGAVSPGENEPAARSFHLAADPPGPRSAAAQTTQGAGPADAAARSGRSTAKSEAERSDTAAPTTPPDAVPAPASPPSPPATTDAGAGAGALVPSQPPLPTPAEAIAAYEMKDYAKARQLAEPLAVGGNADCQFIMGRLYHIGGAIRRDDEKAVAWYEKAARQGHARAQFNLAVMYETGDGVLASKKTAAEFYRMAAVGGIPYAQYNLALMYARGLGVEQDLSQARRWFGQAAKSADPEIAAKAADAIGMLGEGAGRRSR